MNILSTLLGSLGITRYCYLDGATWFLFNGGSLKKSQRLETRAVSNIQRQVNLFYFSFISLTEERFLFPYKSSNRQRVKVTNNRSYDLRRRSSVASYWPAPLCFRRSRCRSAVSSGDRCNPYGTWSKHYSCGTWRAAPAGWPGWRRGVCTCACTNESATVGPRHTTCRLRNRRFEWGIPAACKTTFIWFFLSLSLSPFAFSLRLIIVPRPRVISLLTPIFFLPHTF